MTTAELYTGLLEAGYPVAYRAFKSAQTPPFICYLFVSSADLMADDENYHALSDFDVELYTDDKDPTAEAALEAELRVMGLVWSKSETFIESEGMHEVVYSVRI